MITFRRILHPTDFSQNAKAAQEYACQLAAQNGAELHLLNVFPEAAFLVAQPEFASVPGAYWEDLRAAAGSGLETVLERAWADKLKVVRSARSGSPFYEIVRYAQEAEIDLIVIGTHGRTGLSHLIVGTSPRTSFARPGVPCSRSIRPTISLSCRRDPG